MIRIVGDATLDEISLYLAGKQVGRDDDEIIRGYLREIGSEDGIELLHDWFQAGDSYRRLEV